jgi:hypothetical protein
VPLGRNEPADFYLDLISATHKEKPIVSADDSPDIHASLLETGAMHECDLDRIAVLRCE